MAMNFSQPALRFWATIESHFSLSIPLHIRHIFKFYYLDNPVAFPLVSENLLLELQDFARTRMISLVPPNSNKVDYFATSADQPTNFGFLDSEKHVLLTIKDFVDSKNEEYWQIHNLQINLQHQSAFLSNKEMSKMVTSQFKVAYKVVSCVML